MYNILSLYVKIFFFYISESNKKTCKGRKYGAFPPKTIISLEILEYPAKIKQLKVHMPHKTKTIVRLLLCLFQRLNKSSPVF